MTIEEFYAFWLDETPLMTVKTSGSTGLPKTITVEKRRMRASAEMTCRRLNLRCHDTALLCMPVDFIAGKMMAVRCEVGSLRLFAVEPSAHPLSDDNAFFEITVGKERQIMRRRVPMPDRFDFVAMTPAQVFTSLEVAAERKRLMNCRHLLIGGGSISDELETALRSFPNNVWSSYGMTETLSHIALRRVNGSQRSDFYEPLDGITVGQSEDGCLWIDAPQIVDGRLTTNDIVDMAADGSSFRIVGRKDNVICSGGIKIQAEEVERRLASRVRVHYIISSRSDAQYGSVVVLLFEKGCQTAEDIAAICREELPRYYRPKQIIEVDTIPMTATGKPDRAAIARLAESSKK